MDQVAHHILYFDGFTLDLTRGYLRIGGQDVDLRPKAFDVLRHLAENAGRLMPKQELIEEVWPNTHVSDDSLAQCIRELRHKLGDREHRLIRTVSRRGYLLDAVPVGAQVAAPGAEPGQPGAEEGNPQPVLASRRPGIMVRPLWVAVGLGIVLLVAGAIFAVRPVTPDPQPAAREISGEELHRSLMRRILSVRLTGSIDPEDEGKPNYYAEAPRQKSLAVCMDWEKSTPYRLEYKYFGFSRNNLRQEDADEKALSHCYRSSKIACNCIIVDRNGTSALQLPSMWLQQHARRSSPPAPN